MKPITITSQVQSAGTSQPLCIQCCSSECTSKNSDSPSKLLKIDKTNHKHFKETDSFLSLTDFNAFE